MADPESRELNEALVGCHLTTADQTVAPSIGSGVMSEAPSGQEACPGAEACPGTEACPGAEVDNDVESVSGSVVGGDTDDPQTSGDRTSKDSSLADYDVRADVVTSSTAKKQTRAEKVKDKKTRRKEDKALETVVKSLSAMKSPEEKLSVLLKRYSELHEENKNLILTSKQNERKASVACRDKDHLQLEHSKTLLAKNKLESLCRELQKYNREVKEESLTRARLEEEKRREIAAKFQGSLTDIQDRMNDNQTTNNTLREENKELTAKLRGLIEQYEKAQTTVDKVFQRNNEMNKELETHQKQKELLMLELQQSYKKCELMEEQEKQLRLQLNTYTEKYTEFQSSLQTSNQVFQSFKGEMEKMTKKIKKLEKESLQWKQQAVNSNKTLLTMAEEKNRTDKEKAILLLKIKRLEDLCRALQAERNGATSAGQNGNQTVINDHPVTSPVAKPDGEASDHLAGSAGTVTGAEIINVAQTADVDTAVGVADEEADEMGAEDTADTSTDFPKCESEDSQLPNTPLELTAS